MSDRKNVECNLSARVTEFSIPPVSDGLVIGKDSPIGYSAISRALQLLAADHFRSITVNDDVISHIIVRAKLLNRVPEEKIVSFVLARIKPLLASDEILHLVLTAEIHIQDSER